METGPFSIFLSYEVFLYGVWGIQLFSFFCSVYFATCDIRQIGVDFFSWFTTELEGWDSLYVGVFFDVHLLIPIHRFILYHDLRSWRLWLTPTIYSLN